MKTYNSYWVWYRNEPFLGVLANDQKDVEQFIVDWCMSNSVRPVADEWLIRQVDSVISKDVVSEVVADVGGGAGIMNPAGMGTLGKGYEPIKLKMHPRCF